jgi:ATP-dependent Clp protease adaptor protein ClpS
MATRQRDGTILEPAKAKVKPPKMFKVMLLNDDYTPMDFVVSVLQTFFSLSRERGLRTALELLSLAETGGRAAWNKASFG